MSLIAIRTLGVLATSIQKNRHIGMGTWNGGVKMSLETIFTTGTLAKGYREIAAWYAMHSLDIEAAQICLPFFGFGRLASAMCQDYTTIDSCDFQRLSSAIWAGVFAATEYRTNITQPKFRKGPAVAGEFLKGEKYAPDLRSAGFIDYVTRRGTDLDIACLGMAIPAQTLRGWLTQWTGNFESFWTKFCQLRYACAPQVDMPGTWNHFEADLFEILGQFRPAGYDVLAIDPPRLCPTTDLYSRGWAHLNHVLGGTVTIQPWTARNYTHKLQQVFTIPSRYALFSWTEGDGPPYRKDIEYWLSSHGQVEDQAKWQTYGKTIHGWRIKRM